MQKKLFQYNKILVSDIALAVLVFVVVVFVSYWQTKRANATAARVANTLEILFHKEKIASLATDHETGSRAYILTGQSQFLEIFKQSKSNIPAEIKTLRQLTASSLYQKLLIDSLSDYFQARENFVDSVISVHQDIGPQAAATLLITGKGKMYMDQIRRLLDHLQQEENSLYRQHVGENEKALRTQNRIFLGVVFFMLIALLFFSWREKRRTVLEEKKRLEQVVSNEKRFRALVENNENIIALIDENFKSIYRSPASERITGWSPADREKVGTTEQNHPEDMERVNEMMKQVVVNPGKPYPILMRTRHKNGTWVWLEGFFTNRFHDPAVKAIVVNLRDVTEEQAVKEEIVKLNEQLEEKVASRTDQLQAMNNDMEAFTYSVSHDLRAPLRIINGFTVILEEDYAAKLDDEARRLTSIIKKNTTKMGNLIDGLLDFSRMRLQDIHKTQIDTVQLVEETIKSTTDTQQIEWIVSTLPDTWGDLNAIRQVWINLVSNAVKYSKTKEHPKIEIGSFEEGGQTVFFVKDNGVGFDPEYKGKLFKVFQRLHAADEFEGTGIGLAVVHKVVSKHGGKVWAEGEVGKGAAFYFSLPGRIEN